MVGDCDGACLCCFGLVERAKKLGSQVSSCCSFQVVNAVVATRFDPIVVVLCFVAFRGTNQTAAGVPTGFATCQVVAEVVGR